VRGGGDTDPRAAHHNLVMHERLNQPINANLKYTLGQVTQPQVRDTDIPPPQDEPPRDRAHRTSSDSQPRPVRRLRGIRQSSALAVMGLREERTVGAHTK
jgi:hypothetical protein